MLFKIIGVDKSAMVRAKVEVDPVAQYRTASIVVRITTKGIAQHMEKSAKNLVMKTTSKLYVKVVKTMKVVPKGIIQTKIQKGKRKKVP